MENPLLQDLSDALSRGQVITSARRTARYREGMRVGNGIAMAVVKPHTLLEIWKALQVCIKHDAIIIMQAAKTGITGGSTPYGEDYDRPVIIISTLKVDKLALLNRGTQVLAYAGATLHKLEQELLPIKRSPHSVIGSSCIGASIVGGVCNNSGGNLVNRGPAYTQLSLFAQLSKTGELELVNNLDMDLGEGPEEILNRLDNDLFQTEVGASEKLASDTEYEQRVREIEQSSPARYNADTRRLYEASGCAGKIAVFAVRLDTFAQASSDRVFYIGTNKPEELNDIREHMLKEFPALPEMAEYMHREYFNAAEKYGKDTFLFVRYLGTGFLPRLFAAKAFVDSYLDKLPLLPAKSSEHILQFISRLWPKHLPKRLRDYRDRYEHHLLIKANDACIDETREFLLNYFAQHGKGSFFEATEKEGKAALLHRLVAGGAGTRHRIVRSQKLGDFVPLDISLPRNFNEWYSTLPADLEAQIEGDYRLSHFFCRVFHWDFVLRKGSDAATFKEKILAHLDAIGAKYPAEHNVGHIYEAEDGLKDFYQSLDPSNSFNPGIGHSSRKKFYR